MKAKFTTTLAAVCFGLAMNAQTLTYSSFSKSLTQTQNIKIADNTSYNASLSTTTGNNVTWDARSLTQKSGTPIVHFIYGSPSSTPQGSQYPNSNYCEYDPALVAAIDYNYYGIHSDSLVDWGSYSPDGSHEIFQNPDKRLIFPFAYNQSFTDTYAKTNYSNATTVSSTQTGNRTVTFIGYGTLQLPQGTVSNVAMIKEVRTNSLGPDSYYYSWIRLNDGMRLLFRSENDGKITTAWNSDANVGIEDNEIDPVALIFPNPTHSTVNINLPETTGKTEFKLSNLAGEIVLNKSLTASMNSISVDELTRGIYFYQLIGDSQRPKTGKLVIE